MEALGRTLDRVLPVVDPGRLTVQSSHSTVNWPEAIANRNAMTIDQAREIACARLPAPEPCSERHFNQCLRVLLSALPKRNSDEVSGELLIAAYQRKLGGFCRDQINYLSDKALERCEWFPSIAECLSILSGWQRDDDIRQLHDKAKSMVLWERQARDCQDFRVWAGIMGKKESHYVPTQRTGDTG